MFVCACLSVCNILCLHEPIQERVLLMPAEVRSGHRGVLSSPTAVGREAGEAFSASGKQSGPNWSLTGLRCLHLLGESEDPAAWSTRAAIGLGLSPFISITTDK